MRNALLVMVVLAIPRLAHASAWYYTWTCSGGCAPGRLTIDGVEGPYGSYDDCEMVRVHDSRNQEFLAEGNLGGTHSCQESDTPPTPDSSGSGGHGYIPLQRIQFALLGGAGWRVRDAMGETAGDSTTGFEVAMIGGARPIFGIEISLGVQSSVVDAPHFNGEPHRITYVPLLFGITSSPGSSKVRLDLGADFGFLMSVGCSTCEADGLDSGAFIYSLRAGLDVYVRRKLGVGLAAVFLFAKHGDINNEFLPSMIEVTAPTFLVRGVLTLRNGSLAW